MVSAIVHSTTRAEIYELWYMCIGFFIPLDFGGIFLIPNMSFLLKDFCSLQSFACTYGSDRELQRGVRSVSHYKTCVYLRRDCTVHTSSQFRHQFITVRKFVIVLRLWSYWFSPFQENDVWREFVFSPFSKLINITGKSFHHFGTEVVFVDGVDFGK